MAASYRKTVKVWRVQEPSKVTIYMWMSESTFDTDNGIWRGDGGRRQVLAHLEDTP